MHGAASQFVTLLQIISRQQFSKTQYSWHAYCNAALPNLPLWKLRRRAMDLVFVLAIVGFFALCVGYTYVFDWI
jgi:hypothetical protein